MKVTLIVPTLNEIEGMREIMPRLKPEWYDQLLIIDGGSTDGTIEFAKQQGYSVISQKRRGMRHAYLETLPFVEGDAVITFSPDGNSLPECIPDLVEMLRQGYDMVIVSRYKGGAHSQDDTFISGLANRVFTKTINLLFRASYTDALVIYRAYRKALIHELDLDKEASYSPAESLFRVIMSWEMLLSIRAVKRRLKIGEISGDEPCRIGGRRKLHVKWGFAYMFQLLREVFVWQ
ncbi:MAG: glycosyltransferase family 2 protein [bacterium]